MKPYIIYVPKLTWLMFTVQAESETEAIEKHKNDKDEYYSFVDDETTNLPDTIKSYAEEDI